jgi:hypothetical protein
MAQVLLHFDNATLQAIDRIAPAAKRKRAEFIRQTVKDAIFGKNILDGSIIFNHT